LWYKESSVHVFSKKVLYKIATFLRSSFAPFSRGRVAENQHACVRFVLGGSRRDWARAGVAATAPHACPWAASAARAVPRRDAAVRVLYGHLARQRLPLKANGGDS